MHIATGEEAEEVEDVEEVAPATAGAPLGKLGGQGAGAEHDARAAHRAG